MRAEKSELTITAGAVDTLAAGVDILGAIAAAAGTGIRAWLKEHASEVARVAKV